MYYAPKLYSNCSIFVVLVVMYTYVIIAVIIYKCAHIYTINQNVTAIICQYCLGSIKNILLNEQF